MTEQEILNMNALARAKEAAALKPVAPPPAPMPEYDHANQSALQEVRAIQHRADKVFAEYGKVAPAHNANIYETPLQYRLRLANELKPYSEKFADTELSVYTDSASLAPLEQVIYEEATENAKDPKDLLAGQVREIIKADQSGRAFSEFVGRSHGTFRNVYPPSCFGPVQEGVIKIDGLRKEIPYPVY